MPHFGYFGRACFALTLLITSSLAFAGNFKLDKTRIVLDENTRRDEIRIYNDSDTLQSFKVTLIEMQMTEEGTLVGVEKYDHSAKPYLRIGPRISRDVAPNTFQKVRIIKKKTPPKGEYRSHLLVESLTEEPVKQVQGVFVRPKIKYVIPVFVKNDEGRASLSFGDMIASEDGHVLLSLQRTGDGSINGNIVLADAHDNELFRANQVSVYPELSKRLLKTTLAHADVAGKSLLVKFEDPAQDNKVVLQQSISL